MFLLLYIVVIVLVWPYWGKEVAPAKEKHADNADAQAV